MEIPRSVSHGLKKEPTSWDAHPSGQRQYLIVFGDLPERRKVGFHWHWMDAQKGYSAIHQYDLETILVELTIFSPYFTELKYQMLVLFLHQSPFLVLKLRHMAMWYEVSPASLMNNFVSGDWKPNEKATDSKMLSQTTSDFSAEQQP